MPKEWWLLQQHSICSRLRRSIICFCHMPLVLLDFVALSWKTSQRFDFICMAQCYRAVIICGVDNLTFSKSPLRWRMKWGGLWRSLLFLRTPSIQVPSRQLSYVARKSIIVAQWWHWSFTNAWWLSRTQMVVVCFNPLQNKWLAWVGWEGKGVSRLKSMQSQ